VHFHSYPILSRTSAGQGTRAGAPADEVPAEVAAVSGSLRNLQQQVVLTVPPHLRVIVYRRLMMRIAERLALTSGARALVTGDAVGQVASQTLANLQAVGEVSRLPILRPLIGFHKEEITQDAVRIGTYRTSIVKDDDCCTLFTPRYPTTGARPGEAEVAEKELDVEALVQSALADVVVEDYAFPESTEDTEESISHGATRVTAKDGTDF
jgi:thiamine biosynthesis protein ThiI